jgi:hypothetical protein
MPTYSIRGPDGKVYSIEGPEGATREEVVAAIQIQLATQKAHAEAGVPSVSAVPSHTDDMPVAMETAFVTLWSSLLSLLIFRATAYKHWKRARVTPAENGVWCGGIAAALSPFGVMSKLAQRVSVIDYAASLMVVVFLYFLIGLVVGFFWRKFKPVPIPD